MAQANLGDWKKVAPQLAEALEEAAAELPDVERRSMFGCPCLFVNGNMLAGAHFAGVFVRLGDADREECLALDGAAHFEPMPGRAMREYVVPPPPVVADAAALGAWLARAHAYVSQLPPKEPKPRRPRR
ncbi:MAG: TfoX/Sxy family protein [Armatimonadetes bacterium]|nr:TfoX/Sxy family protein [Armatimonadota bacterium]